ncbi:hypothetical protein FBU30_003836 [Linnemannia zychae]|nr:hypothetical protein FBU30_003836 [Linnemannia zychae]
MSAFKGSVEQQTQPQPKLSETLDKAHEALSTILMAAPFSTADAALEQTSAHLQLTVRCLSDSYDQLARSQSHLTALVSHIQHFKEFLPEIGHSYKEDSNDDD